MRVRIIAFQGALYLEIVTVHQIFDVRILYHPFQFVTPGVGAGLVRFLRCSEIMDAVIGRDIHGRTAKYGGVTRGIVHHLELRRHLADCGIRGLNEKGSGTLGVGQRNHRRWGQRNRITLRLIVYGIGDARIAVTRHAVLVQGIEIRSEQLRSCQRVSRVKTTETPVVVVIAAAAIGLVDIYVEFDLYLSFPVHRCGWIPVELQKRHMLVSVMLPLNNHQLRRPLGIAGNVIRRAVGHRGYRCGSHTFA